jgi:kumamolisin
VSKLDQVIKPGAHLSRQQFEKEFGASAVDIAAVKKFAGGHGLSVVQEPLPRWQTGLQVTSTKGGRAPLTMRGVPDVSGNADPQTGYEVRIDGSDTVIGGTSAVAPLWAGLITRINAANGNSVGYLNPTLYANPSAFHDMTTGNNGSFAAGPSWDACTGLGSPNGTAIASLFQSGGTGAVARAGKVA